MLAPSWSWVVLANILLGLNQGLTWSTTVVMKIDLAGPHRRGLAMGLNEFSGYFAVALSAGASGLLASRYGLRPEPLFLGLAVVAIGLGLSSLAVRETSAHARLEGAGQHDKSFAEVAALASFRDRGLAAASRTGLVNNANDALAWGLLPLMLSAEGLSTSQIGAVAGLYPAVWGLTQLVTGPLSDRIGRRLPIAFGMWLRTCPNLFLPDAGVCLEGLCLGAARFGHRPHLPLAARRSWGPGRPSMARCGRRRLPNLARRRLRRGSYQRGLAGGRLRSGGRSRGACGNHRPGRAGCVDEPRSIIK
jgi:MFS family permease